MGQLADAANKMSTFLRVQPGSEVTAMFKSWRIIPNKFDPEKDTFQYTLVIDGVKKFWETGSPSVAFFFDSVNEGEIVSIKNVGDEKKSKYVLKVVVGKNAGAELSKETKVTEEAPF